jgi:hypothetical protein
MIDIKNETAGYIVLFLIMLIMQTYLAVISTVQYTNNWGSLDIRDDKVKTDHRLTSVIFSFLLTFVVLILLISSGVVSDK